MTLFLTLAAVLLLGTVAAGLVRIFLGPTRADRMMAAQIIGTSGVAVILLIARIEALPELVDIALVLALLTVLAAVAFVRRAWRHR